MRFVFLFAALVSSLAFAQGATAGGGGCTGDCSFTTVTIVTDPAQGAATAQAGSSLWAARNFDRNPWAGKVTSGWLIDANGSVIAFAAANVGTGGSNAKVTVGAQIFTKQTSGAVSGNTASVAALSTLGWSQRPRMITLVRTDASIAVMRLWVGLNDNGLDACDSCTSKFHASFRYSTVAGDTTWQACTADGAAQSCTNTGVTVAVSTNYVMEVDCSAGTSCNFWINGTKVVSAKATNIPSGTGNRVGASVMVATQEAVAKAVNISWAYIERDST